LTIKNLDVLCTYIQTIYKDDVRVVGGCLHVVKGIVGERGLSFSVSGRSRYPWAITVRGWVGSLSMTAGSSLSMSGGVIVCEQVVVVCGRSPLSMCRGSSRCSWCRSWWIVVVWDRRSWVVAIRTWGGACHPSVEGVVVLREWGEGPPLSVRAHPPWVVVIPRWGSSLYVGGQHSRMGGGGVKVSCPVEVGQ
jgi:hypothetical protein